MRVLPLAIAVMLSGGLTVATPAAADSTIPPPNCAWDPPEYPHVSSVNRNAGSIDIKVGGSGKCQASTEPITVSASMSLERLWWNVAWVPVNTKTITKTVLNNPASFRRGELFGLMSPCVPGIYRGWLDVTYTYQGTGKVISPDWYSAAGPPVEVTCLPTQASLVIDDTGSMGDVIGSVKSALAGYITSQPPDEYTSWSLTTFKDSPTTVGTTEDRDEILGWVNALSAGGGGDCPEDALGGITAGIDALGNGKGDKQMVVATDASAHGGDVDGIIARAKAAGVRVNVLLTGDCDMTPAGAAAIAEQQQGGKAIAQQDVQPPVSSQVVLKRIAQQTGGKYYYLPTGTTEDFSQALNEIFTSFTRPAPTPTTSTTRLPSPPPSPGASASHPHTPTAAPSPDTGLPITGQSLIPLVVTAALLITAGVLLAYWARRRRLEG